MSAPRKKPFRVGALGYVFGVTCFFLVIPFGITFGILHRLVGNSNRTARIDSSDQSRERSTALLS